MCSFQELHLLFFTNGDFVDGEILSIWISEKAQLMNLTYCRNEIRQLAATEALSPSFSARSQL